MMTQLMTCSWNDDGSSFIVWNPTVFARDLLPKCFKHNNFSSFGFRKVVPDRWEFSNDCFRRGEKRPLSEIQRRKISSPTATAIPIPLAKHIVSPLISGDKKSPIISSASSPSRQCRTGTVMAELMAENKKLRKENMQLNEQLAEVKNLCNNIFSLMSKYSTTSQSETRPLELLPLNRSLSPKLFGVEIGGGSKRAREGDEGAAAEDDETQLQLQLPGGIGNEMIKSEPCDCTGSNGDRGNEDTPWLRQLHKANQKV